MWYDTEKDREEMDMDPTICESCWHYDHDEAFDLYECRMELDEDEFARIFSRPEGRCPYYQKGDDYTLARRQ